MPAVGSDLHIEDSVITSLFYTVYLKRMEGERFTEHVGFGERRIKKSLEPVSGDQHTDLKLIDEAKVRRVHMADIVYPPTQEC